MLICLSETGLFCSWYLVDTWKCPDLLVAGSDGVGVLGGVTGLSIKL